MKPEMNRERKFELTLYTCPGAKGKIGWWKQRSVLWRRGFVIRIWKAGVAVRWGWRDKPKKETFGEFLDRTEAECSETFAKSFEKGLFD